jgi:hypothetical protein
MNDRNRFNDEAVSETLGYIIIFGIIVACIAMVYMIGSQIIADTQESTSFQGMEQNFEVIGSDLRRTAFEASPVMTTRVQIDHGTLYLQPADVSGSMMVVDFDGNRYVTRLGTLGFQSSKWGKFISLEDGALVKMYSGNGSFGTIMSLDPKMFYSGSTDTLFLSVLDIKNGGGTLSTSGGISNIQSKYEDSKIFEYTSSDFHDVNICMRTNYTGAWNDYFTTKFDPALVVSDTGDPTNWTNATVTGVKRLVIARYNISVSI